MAPAFAADLPGAYAVLLTVFDGEVGSLPAQVHVSLPVHPHNDAFTVSRWARPADINGWHMLFTKWDDPARRHFIHFALEGGHLQFSVSSTGTGFGIGLNDPRIPPRAEALAGDLPPGWPRRVGP